MKKQKYEMLVWSLQGEAKDYPGLFRAKVLLISLFAYLVLFFLLAVLGLGLIYLFIAARDNNSTVIRIFFAGWFLVVAPIGWHTFRMFFASHPAPKGRVLTDSEAPRLFSMISGLRTRLQGAPIHHVLITQEFNAAIAQCPRFGLFGGYRNYLILGLPILYALSEEEILAVVAHEYGHLAGNHAKFSGWIYRQRTTFGALYEHAQQRRSKSKVNNIFASLLDWFGPYYNAHTFVLSRQNEYEADEIASQIAGSQASASALIRTRLLATWLSEIFWPKMYAQAGQNPMPSVMPNAAMRKLLLITMDEWATKECLSEAWKKESNVYDTHPCLRERVTALDERSVLPSIPKIFAADALLGSLVPDIAREFDEAWWKTGKVEWQKHHRRITRSHTRIAELEHQPLEGLSVPDAQELALLLVEFRSVSAAKSVLENLLSRTGKQFPKPVYFYGCALLEEENLRGLDYLEEAYRLSPAMGENCARSGYKWLQ